ncbi:MAG: type II toxin-antitoxin system ParD family antitoxin [Pseudomonadota bacterium]
MTIHINLSPEMEGFIKNKVASGFYGNATEVIRDAIRRMQSEEERATAWKNAIKQGDNELNAGKGIEYNAQTLEDVTRNAITSTHSKKPIDPDVLP